MNDFTAYQISNRHIEVKVYRSPASAYDVSSPGALPFSTESLGPASPIALRTAVPVAEFRKWLRPGWRPAYGSDRFVLEQDGDQGFTGRLVGRRVGSQSRPAAVI
jgi:hypothetical protein